MLLNINKPELIQGGVAVDDRGQLLFCNDFKFDGVKRYYAVTNHAPGFVRAWHGHEHEAKYVTVVAGAAIVCAVTLDDLKTMRLTEAHRHVLSAAKPAVFYIPPGYANGFKSLTAGTVMMYFSTATMAETQADDLRYPADRFAEVWEVKLR